MIKKEEFYEVFNWKTAIVSLVIFIVPIFFYPVSGTMTNGVTTYSYGFPSNWLSVQFDTQGGRLFGFELFGANIVGTNISILTALLDLLVIYLVVTAFVKVFWINHFSIKFSNWREMRRCKKEGIPFVSSEFNQEKSGKGENIISNTEVYEREERNGLSRTEQTVKESFQTHPCKDELQSDLLEKLEKDKTA